MLTRYRALYGWDTELGKPWNSVSNLYVPLRDKPLKTWKMRTPPLGTIRLLPQLWSTGPIRV
jgi:hypothetical protein